MEEKLLELLKFANKLNEKQDKVYVQITYYANDVGRAGTGMSHNDMKTLEIAVRSKKDFSFVEKCEMQLKGNYDIKCNNIMKLLESYIQEV